MSKIKLLSENLANQIAAGEVVERPASVVKEFVENSLDAGATRVDVQVEGNGTRLIRVIDNGEGMDGDDVLLCLERHATSKLRSQEDLAAIRSLGFRGEALPSIASVAKLTITSRPQTAVLGTRVEVRFGTLVRVHEMGCPQGTCMEVRDLFGNVPARRKFLKSAKTELSHLEEVVVNYALAQPGLGFGFTVDGRELLNLPAATDTLESRIGRLVGKGGGQQLIPVGSDEGDGKALRVWGYLLPPDSAFAVSARLRLFVNGRAVRDRMLAHAVVEGMHEFLLKGRRPAGAVFVELPAGLVDVNVHPTKQEIRFRDSAEVHGQVVDAVRTAMQSYQDTVRFAVFGAPSVVAVEARQPVAEQEPAGLRQSALPGRATMAEPQVDYPARPRPTGEAIATRRAEPAECRAPVTPAPLPAAAGHPAGAPRPSAPPEASATPAVRLLGQLYNSYILCEVDGGLVAIDNMPCRSALSLRNSRPVLPRGPLLPRTCCFPSCWSWPLPAAPSCNSSGPRLLGSAWISGNSAATPL